MSVFDILTPMPWSDDAACVQVDPDEFYPVTNTVTPVAAAACARCPVAAQCLDHALTHGEGLGTWGGLSASQRRELRSTIPTDDDAVDDTWFGDGDDFTYDTDLGEPA